MEKAVGVEILGPKRAYARHKGKGLTKRVMAKHHPKFTGGSTKLNRQLKSSISSPEAKMLTAMLVVLLCL